MLKSLLDFKDGDIGYNKVKKYLPNYIRRILETFLSFKFSMINSKNSKFRSPGLLEFENSIKQTDLDDKNKKDIIYKEVENFLEDFSKIK